MALKSDRYELQTDISFFCDTVATRGGVVSLNSTASGAAMDQGVNLVEYAAATTGTPVGILLNDVVNKDLTRTHLNFYKDEVQKGGKVTVLRKGWVVTNTIDGSPSAGDVAYLGADGDIAATGTVKIGQFFTAKDADGYAKVEVDLPSSAV